MTEGSLLDAGSKVYDLQYRDDGLFTSFLPNTPSGEVAWRELNAQNENSHKVLSVHAASVIEQLRTAGYSVGVAEEIDLSAESADELLDDLYSKPLDDLYAQPNAMPGVLNGVAGKHYGELILDDLVAKHGWAVRSEGSSVSKDVGGQVRSHLNPNGELVVFGALDDLGRYLALEVGFNEPFDIDCRRALAGGDAVARIAEEFDERVTAFAVQNAKDSSTLKVGFELTRDDEREMVGFSVRGSERIVEFGGIPAILWFAEEKDYLPKMVIDQMLAMEGGFSLVRGHHTSTMIKGCDNRVILEDTPEKAWALAGEMAVVDHSLKEAERIAASKGEMPLRAELVNGEHGGTVMGVTERHVVLSLGRVALIAEKAGLDREVRAGEAIEVVFKDGKGVVKDAMEKGGVER